MRAARLVKYGGKDSIRVQEAPQPEIDPDQVLVEVAAAGVNPFDITVREGRARQMADPKLPATLGGDFSGIIIEVGKDVTGFQVGQAVYGQAKALSGNGSFAEFTPAPPTQMALKPGKLNFTQAGAVPLTASSAHQALIEHAKLQGNQKILIHGGAGGIGSMAVQLAKHLGAYVSTTASANDADFVKQLGADQAIDYKTQDFSQIIKDYDVVFDTVGGDTNIKSYQVLRPGGTLVSMTAKPEDELVKKYNIQYFSQFSHVTTERLNDLAKLFDQGALKSQIDKVFPLDQAAEAVEYLKTGHPHGKIVIQIK